MRAWWCCGEVGLLEAEVTGSVSYTVNGSQSVQPWSSCGWRRRFTSQSFRARRLEPCAHVCGPISGGNCLSLLILSWHCSGGWEDATLCL